MANKEKELSTLKAIKALVDELGEESYVATAFNGAFEIAEDNINNDCARSTQYYVDKADELIQLDACLTMLNIAKGINLSTDTLFDHFLTSEQLQTIALCLYRYHDRYLNKRKAEIKEKIIKYATTPESTEFLKAVREHTNIVKEIDTVLEIYNHIADAVEEIG